MEGPVRLSRILGIKSSIDGGANEGMNGNLSRQACSVDVGVQIAIEEKE